MTIELRNMGLEIQHSKSFELLMGHSNDLFPDWLSSQGIAEGELSLFEGFSDPLGELQETAINLTEATFELAFSEIKSPNTVIPVPRQNQHFPYQAAVTHDKRLTENKAPKQTFAPPKTERNSNQPETSKARRFKSLGDFANNIDSWKTAENPDTDNGNVNSFDARGHDERPAISHQGSSHLPLRGVADSNAGKSSEMKDSPSDQNAQPPSKEIALVASEELKKLAGVREEMKGANPEKKEQPNMLSASPPSHPSNEESAEPNKSSHFQTKKAAKDLTQANEELKSLSRNILERKNGTKKPSFPSQLNGTSGNNGRSHPSIGFSPLSGADSSPGTFAKPMDVSNEGTNKTFEETSSQNEAEKETQWTGHLNEATFIDKDDIVDALTKHLNEEYRRFFGPK